MDDPALPAPAIAPETPPPTAAKRRIAPSRFVAYTWARQWPAEVLMGLCGGILSFTAFALQRSMNAPAWTSQHLIVLGQGLWILAPAWPAILSRVKHQQTFLWLGVLSRGPLLLVAFASVTATPSGLAGAGVGDWPILFGTFLLANNLDQIYTPHRNALMRANYPLEVRGRVYGLVSLVSGVAGMAASLAVGQLLDHDPTVIRWAFPAAAALGILGYVQMARIRWRHEGPRVGPQPGGYVVGTLKNAFLASWKTMRDDKGFRAFEIGFLVYGMGLLAADPLIVSRFARDPAFTTSDWAWAQRVVLPATQLLFIWLIGMLSDRIGVVTVAALAFAGLAPFYVLMCFVSAPGHLSAAYVLFGICMAGINVPWALGPLLFAPRGQAHHYMAVHVAWVGVRSALAPLMGMFVKNALGYETALIVSATFEVAAAWWMFRLARRVRLQG